jgi:hypothetical protein
MIISHKHKFIFLKTRKTAGTSIEIALARHCGPQDVLTPLTKTDEELRREAGVAGPQNFRIGFPRYRFSDWVALLAAGRRARFVNHGTAEFVRRHVDEAVWGNYFTFCFERNPFDKAISRYYWSARRFENPPELNPYLCSAPLHLLSDWNIYAIADKVAVDFVGRYERLTEDLDSIRKRIGLPTLELIRAKGSHRPDRRPYRELLNAESRAHIERVCAREMAAFGYAWE